MRIPIVDIGNSKGIRIPQAVLKQTLMGNEVEMEVSEGQIVLRRLKNPSAVPDFEAIADMDDLTIQRMLRKISGTDLMIAMVNAEAGIKEALYRNLSDRAKGFVKAKLDRLEKGDARDLIIERSRSVLTEALMEVAQE